MIDHQQGTAEWRQSRCGFVTASRICDVMRKPRRGQTESTSRKAYMAQLVAERLTGKPQAQEFESWDTRRGNELEPIARAEYEIKRGVMVATVGSVPHPSIALASASPDGLVGEDGMVQIKAPRTHVHLDYLMAGTVPAEYRPQMYFELACTGRKWSDFVSYDQTLPDHLQLFVVRLNRDEAEIALIETEVLRFLAEIDEIISKLPRKEGQTALEAQLERSLGINDGDVPEFVKAAK